MIIVSLFLLEYCSECEEPGDSVVFVRILNLLLLAQRFESSEDDEEDIDIVHDFHQTLILLKKCAILYKC